MSLNTGDQAGTFLQDGFDIALRKDSGRDMPRIKPKVQRLTPHPSRLVWGHSNISHSLVPKRERTASIRKSAR